MTFVLVFNSDLMLVSLQKRVSVTASTHFMANIDLLIERKRKTRKTRNEEVKGNERSDETEESNT